MDYREFLKFVRDAGGHMESTGPSATPRLVDASSKAYDGFYGGASSDRRRLQAASEEPAAVPSDTAKNHAVPGDSAPEASVARVSCPLSWWRWWDFALGSR